jgi:RHS repeat-associated protein
MPSLFFIHRRLARWLLPFLLTLEAVHAESSEGRTIRLVPSPAVATQGFEVGVDLIAVGNENAAGFSLLFDTNRIRFEGAVPTPGRRLLVNTNQAGQGRVGLAISEAPGKVFAFGTNRLLTLRLRAGETVGATALSFGDVPIVRETVAGNADFLTTLHQPVDVVVEALQLPGFAQSPSDLTAHAGTNVALSATATGSPPLRVTWVKDGVILPQATGSMLAFVPLRSADAGSYRAIASNGGGSVTSAVARVTVLPALVPVAITRQPRGLPASAGESVRLEVEAAGSPPLRFRWQKDGVELPGATNSALVLNPVEVGQAGRYRVVVENPISSATSGDALVEVSPTPRVIRLVNQEVSAGTIIQLPVELEGFGDENAIGFSVVFDPVHLEFLAGDRRPEVGLVVLNVQARDAASGRVGIAVAKPPGQAFGRGRTTVANLRFRVGTVPGTREVRVVGNPIEVELSDARGLIRPVTSVGAQVQVLDTPPSILTPPRSVAVRLFDPVRLEVEALGSTPMYFQWFREGQPVAGATNQVLAMVASNAAVAGSYHVVLSNAVRTVTSVSAQVEIRRVVRLSGTNVPTGSTVTLPVEALLAGDENAMGFGLRFDPGLVTLTSIQPGSALTNPSVILRTNGLASGVAAIALALQPGQRMPRGTQTVATLVFQATQNAGTTKVGFTDVPLAREVADSQARILPTDFLDGQVMNYRMAPLIVRHPVPRETTVGDPVVLAVQAEGSLPMQYEWRLNGVPIPSGTNRLVSIPSVRTNDAGNYSVRVFNHVGDGVSSNALLSVNIPDFAGPLISGFTYDFQSIGAGAVLTRSGTLRASAVDPSGVGQMEFYMDGQHLHSDVDGTDGFSGPLDLERFADGDRQLEFRCLDSRGNLTVSNLPVRIALGVPAAVQLTAPADGLITSNRVVRVQGTAPLRTQVAIYRNGERAGADAPVGALGTFDTLVPLVDGTNRIVAAAFNRTGEGLRSTPVNVLVDTSLPPAPGGLRGLARTGGRVRLEWVAASDPVTGYVVYRSTQAFDQRTQATRVTPSAIASTSFEEVPPSEGTWHYRVAQVNKAGVEGLLSIELVIQSDATPPFGRIEYRLAGSTNEVLGTVGPGIVSVTLELTEPSDGAPFLSLTLPGVSPLPVELTSVSPTQYRGNLNLQGVLWSGLARANFSARDKAGNRGDRILSGDRLSVDTIPPRVIALTTDPTAPIRNSSSVPVLATVTARLSEALKPGTVPLLAIRLSRTSPDGVPPLSVSPGAGAQEWTATFRLPAAAGAQPELMTVSFDGEDPLGNRGTEIAVAHQFEVFGDELPPLPAPVGLVARTLVGGSISLTWQSVPGSVGYRVFRSSAAAPLQQIVDEVGTNSWSDLPPADGIYQYTVATVRRVGDRSAIGGNSDPASAASDRTPPARPVGLTVVNAKNGVFAQWTADSGVLEPVTYALFRNGTEFPAEASALTPLIARIPAQQVVDPGPRPDQPYYAVAAVDAAGNRSPLSDPQYLNIRLVPPHDVIVGVTNADPPVITWSQAGEGIAGHDLFLGDEAANVPLNRRGVLIGNRFVDVAYNGGDRTYTLFAVDRNGQRSGPRTVPLPATRVALKAGSELRRGLMNRLVFEVTLDSANPIERCRLSIRVNGRIHSSEDFSLKMGTMVEVPVVVGGYDDLVEDTVGWTGTLELESAPGVLARRSSTGTVAVGHGQVLIGVIAGDLVRGGVAKARFRLTNPGDEMIEVITATSQGAAPSSDIRLSLFDAEGRVLATAPFRSVLGTGHVLLPNGDTVVRLAPGEEKVLPEVDLAVPFSVPRTVWIQVEVDRVLYRSDTDQRVAMRGVKTAAPFEVIATSYTGSVVSVVPERSRGEGPITISGRAWYRTDRQPAPRQPLLVKIANGGFERTESVVTDDLGNFVTTFRPLDGETGGNYSVWAVHPDLTDRTLQGQFVIERIVPSVREFTVRTPYSFRQPLPLVVTAGPGTVATNVRVVIRPEDQPTGSVPSGLVVESGAGIARLDSTQPARMEFHLTASPQVPRKATVVLRLVSGADEGNPWAMLRAECEFSEAFPLLRWSPALVETGVTPGSNVLEEVRLENVGIVAATNVFFSLHRSDGSPLPSWATLATAPNLTSLAVGSQALVGVAFRPPASVADGQHEFLLRVRSGNHPTLDMPVRVAVLTAGRGNAIFRVEDMYTGTVGHDGVIGARVRLRNQAVTGIERTITTDANGEALFEDLPAGLYDYQVTADTHIATNGRLWIRSGGTASQKVMLTYSLVSVEWEVVPITIEDRYEIILTAVFETEVPGAVVTITPAAVNLPQMFVGDVLQGEFVVENHGLIAAQDVAFQLPASDGYIRYELQEGLPDRIAAGQRVRIPYRAICLTSFPGTRAAPPTANATLTKRRSAGTLGVPSLKDLPAQARRIAAASAEGSGCFTHAQSLGLTYRYPCANGEVLGGSAGSRFWYNYSPNACGGGATGGYIVGGPSGPAGGTFTPPERQLPGLPPCCPPENCEPEGECDTKCCNQSNATCSSSPEGPPTPNTPEPTGATPVNLASGARRAGLAGKTEAPVASFKFRNRLLATPAGETYLESDRRRLTFQYDTRGVASVRVGFVEYNPLNAARTLFGYRANRLRTTADGYRWENIDGMWEDYDPEGNLLQTGRRNLLQTVRTRDAAGRLSEVRDARGTLLVRYVRNADGHVTSIEDRNGRSTRYEYEGRRVVRAWDMEGLETSYSYAGDPGCGGRLLVSRVNLPRGQVRNYGFRGSSCEGPIFLSRTTDSSGNGRDEEHRYDPDSRTYYLKTTSTGGEIREKRFDSRGNLIEEHFNGVLQRRILRSGRVDILTDAGGRETLREHDEFGKVVREVAPDGGVTTREYHPIHHLPTVIVNPRGAVTRMAYDPNGNLTNRVDAWGTPIARTNAWVYDSANRMVRHVDGRGFMTDYEYDSNGFLAREFDPENPARQTRYEHDDRGNRTALIDALGHATRYGYDSKDRLVAETNALNHVSLYTYQQDLLVEVETGRDQGQPGRVVRYRYDEQGRRTQTVRVDEAGIEHVWETHSYDGEGHLVATANALGQVTRYEYNGRGERVKVIRPFSATETSDIAYEYDDEGHLAREIDPLGVITAYEYDAMGRQRKVTEAVGTDVQRSRTRGHDLNGNLISIAYSDGTNTLTTFYDYDLLDRRIAIRGAREYPKQFEYDANNNLVAEVNGRGYRTEHRYDPYNRRTNSVEGIKLPSEPGESTGHYVYDLVGRVTMAVDGNGNHQQFHHDPVGRLTAQSIRLMANEGPLKNGWWQEPELTLMSTGFNPWGQTVATTNWAGGTTSTRYDAFGRLTQTKDAAGLILTHGHSPLDQTVAINYPVVSTAPAGSPPTAVRYAYSPHNAQMLVSSTDRAGLVTRYGHDRRFQQKEAVSSWGAITTYRIDPLGRQAAVTNALNEVTRRVFDQFDQIIATVHPDHIPLTQERIEYRAYDEFGMIINHWGVSTYDTIYAYDLAGNRLSLTDANGNTTHWGYDGRNRPVLKQYADKSEYRFSYDANGNTIRKRDAMQRTTRYEFNAYNFIVRTDYQNDSAATFGYDYAGRRVLMVDGTGTNTWSYDAADRVLVNVQSGVQHSVAYTYDTEGMRLSMTVTPHGGKDPWRTTYAYNSAAQLREITDHGVSEVPFRYTWMPNAAQLASLTYPSGIHCSYEYDLLGRKIMITARDNGDVPITHFGYGHDKAGQRTNEISVTQHDCFKYDSKRQLTSVRRFDSSGREVHEASLDYSYDQTGNWRAVHKSGTNENYAVNNLNQYTSVSNSLLRTLVYDPNGNLLNDQINRYQYNDRGLLIGVSNAANSLAFEYDGIGRRVRDAEAKSNSASYLVYDGALMVKKGRVDGFIHYVTRGLDFGNGLHTVGGIGGALMTTTGLDSTALIGDGRGNVRLLWSDKDRVEHLNYSPFNELWGAGHSLHLLGYSGKENLHDVGLVAFGRRYLSMGRWLTRDPAGEGAGLNLYAFVNNDPVNLGDPVGLTPCPFNPLGAHGPKRFGQKGETQAGNTQINFWDLELSRGASASCTTCTEQLDLLLITSSSCSGEYWWSPRWKEKIICLTDGDCREWSYTHENEHVQIFQANWAIAYSKVASLQGCVPADNAASCVELATAYRKYYLSKAHYENAGFDCAEYGGYCLNGPSLLIEIQGLAAEISRLETLCFIPKNNPCKMRGAR